MCSSSNLRYHFSCDWLAEAFLVHSVMKFRNVFSLTAAKCPPLLLGFSLIVGAGEEISWGQHWLGFETPEFVRSVNVLNEFNLHNISSHWANHLMVLFFLSYVGLLPVLARLFSEIRYGIERLNIPLCPVAFVPFAFVGVLMSEASRELWGNPPWSPNEARETLFGVIMMGLSVSFHLTWKDRHSKTAKV